MQVWDSSHGKKNARSHYLRTQPDVKLNVVDVPWTGKYSAFNKLVFWPRPWQTTVPRGSSLNVYFYLASNKVNKQKAREQPNLQFPAACLPAFHM